MVHIVGPRGQVVIEKEIRQQLGIQPGWTALQRLVGDHVEVYFVPPEHNQSLKGSLARHTRIRIEPGEAWQEAREAAWAAAVAEEYGEARDASEEAAPR